MASKYSAKEWQKLIPNIKIILVDIEHSDFSSPSMLPQMAAFINLELKNISTGLANKA